MKNNTCKKVKVYGLLEFVLHCEDALRSQSTYMALAVLPCVIVQFADRKLGAATLQVF